MDELKLELNALDEVSRTLNNIRDMLVLLEQRLALLSSGRMKREYVQTPTSCEDLSRYIGIIKSSTGLDALPYAKALNTYFTAAVNNETEYISCSSLKNDVAATVETVEKAKLKVKIKIPPVVPPKSTTTASAPITTSSASTEPTINGTVTYLLEMPVKVIYTSSSFLI